MVSRYHRQCKRWSENYDDVTHLRFVTISDTHKKHRALSKSNMLPKGDVIIHAGDFTSIGGIKEVKDFVIGLDRYLTNIKSL